MAAVTVSLDSPLSQAEVLQVITDFGPERTRRWPGVDEQHFRVHDQGPNWADVTEGNDATWERVRYTWDADAGTIAASTTESNIWAPGPGWTYRLSPSGTGTRVEVTLTRQGRNLKGKLVAALLPLLGRSVITKSFTGPLRLD